MVWVDHRAGNDDLYGTEVKADGHVVDPSGVPLLQTANDENDPALVATDAEYWLAYTEKVGSNTDIKLASNSRGVVTVTSTAARNESRPAIAWNSAQNEFLIAWSDAPPGSSPPIDVYGTRYRVGNGTLVQPAVALGAAPGDQYGPAVAWNGSDRYAVVWSDTRNGEGDITGLSWVRAAQCSIRRVWRSRLSQVISGSPIWHGTDNCSLFSGTIDGRSRTTTSTRRPRNDGTVTASSGFVVSAASGDETLASVVRGPGTNVGIAYEHMVSPGVTQIFIRTSPK